VKSRPFPTANSCRKFAEAALGIASVGGSGVGASVGIPEGAPEGVEDGSPDEKSDEVGTTVGLAVGFVDGFMLPDGKEVGDGVVGGKGEIVWLVASPLFGGAGIAVLGSGGNASECI
jgi:hypothetical protein